MRPDRRAGGVADRRRHPEAVITTSMEMDVGGGAGASEERKADARPDPAEGRELNALAGKQSATPGGKTIRDRMNWKALRQEGRFTKLKQANEQLVISSIQLQIATEELEKSRAEMAHWAQHDFLTDLPNRMLLNDRVTQAIVLARRRHERIAVLFLDLDRFKLVNDTLGHAIGDKLLQMVAQRLVGALRGCDTVSRYGGDEFVVLLSEVKHDLALSLTIEMIQEIVNAPYCIDGSELSIGVTIGISVFPDDGDDTEALVRNADAAMYHAKKSGREKSQFFRAEMRARAVEWHFIESGLRKATEEHQFELYYQAQVDLTNYAITGAEALIRWRHPSRGLLLPARFVPVAEDSGAIVPIGRWVLREACRQTRAWLDAGLSLDVVAVNISARELERDDFLEHVRAVLRETGLAPDKLELELTESTLMKSLDTTTTTLNELRSMGVRISIDDFGTGYSSLSYLKRFPIDSMKIDQSFVRDISDGTDDILLGAIIGIGKVMRYHVIAEGVESRSQLAFLQEKLCTTVQGFYLSPPMSAEEFALVLAKGLPAAIRSQ